MDLRLKNNEDSRFLTYLRAYEEEFVKWAAQDTGLDVYVFDENPHDDRVAVYTTETGDLTLFWTRFRELRDGMPF